MTRHTKQAIIISVIILLTSLTTLVVVFKHREIKHFYWYLRYVTFEKDNQQYKIETIEKFHKEKFAYFLRKMLYDNDEYVRNLAGVQLYELGNARALEILFPHLKDGNEKDLECAYRYLRCITVAKDCRKYNNEEYNIETVKKLKKGKAIYFLCQLLSKSNYSVTREKACDALGEIGDRRAVESLIKSLKGSDRNVRLFAIGALRKISDKRAVGPLILLLKDGDHGIRSSAALALGEIGDKEAVEPLLALFKDELKVEYFATRSYVASALGELGDKRALTPLREALKHETSDWAKPFMQEALVRLGDDHEFASLIAGLKDKNNVVRGFSAALLGELRDSRAIMPLRNALKGEKGQFARKAMKEAIKKLESLPDKEEK